MPSQEFRSAEKEVSQNPRQKLANKVFWAVQSLGTGISILYYDKFVYPAALAQQAQLPGTNPGAALITGSPTANFIFAAVVCVVPATVLALGARKKVAGRPEAKRKISTMDNKPL